MSDTKARLQWLLSQLDNLNNGGNIRYDGNTTFQGARGELADIINTFVDNSAQPAPVVLQAMTLDQFKDAAGQVQEIVLSVVERVRDEIEKSDAVVISAIVATGQDTVAALKPADETAAQ